MMKGVLVIIDGLADFPCKQLKNKTPLEAAEKPNLDYISSYSEFGEMRMFNEMVPQSDSAVLAILGNGHIIGYRGVFEAIGLGIKLNRGDLALRTNFATIDNLEDKNLVDRRSGRTLTTKEADILANVMNKEVKLSCKFEFVNSIQHRGVLILRGGFSDNVTNTDPAYNTKNKTEFEDRLNFSKPLDEEENSKFSANQINEFVEQSFKVLNKHHINNERRKKGLLPANVILTRDASNELPKIRKFNKWAAITFMPLEIGIAKASGMEVFSLDYPKMKEYDVYKNLYEALTKLCEFAIKTIKNNEKKFDYFYIHFKETDVPGHDGLPLEKKGMVELIDRKFFSFLKKFAEKRKIKILVTPDHATPCILKNHSNDPVPVLFCEWKKNGNKNFSEFEAKKGKLGKIKSDKFLEMVGFVKS